MTETSSKAPYWRLSSFYFFYFASLGALVPYWSLYLKELSFTPTEIGVFVGILMATKIISPNVWGWIADHTGKRMRIVRIGCLLAAISYAGLFLDQSYWWMLAVLIVFSFFWNAALPQFEATTFNHLGDHYYRYSNIRLWGSIGFIIFVWGLGFVFQGFSFSYRGTTIAFEGVSILALPWFVFILLVGIWIASLTVPESASGHRKLDHVSLFKVLKQPHVAALLLVCFFMQASHGPYYAIYSVYMESFNYSKDWIGTLWAIGVIAEVVLFIAMSTLVQRYSLRSLLIFSLAVACLRWFLTAMYPQSVVLMIFAQGLHAVTFGVYHATAIKLIHRFFTGRNQGRGQALYSSLSFGAGGALGSLYSGYVWDHFGRMEVFLLSMLMSAIGLVIAWIWVKPHTQ